MTGKNWIAILLFSIFLIGCSGNSAQQAVAQDVAVFPQLGHTLGIMAVAVSPDGKQIVSAMGDIKFWHIESGREIKTYPKDDIMATSIVYSSDGKHILSGSTDMTVKLWDAESGKVNRTFLGHKIAIKEVKFSANENYILSIASDNELKIWDAKKGNEIKSFYGIITADFSPDEKHIICGTNTGIVLIDFLTGKEVQKFPQNILNGIVCFSPDGKTFLSVASDNIIRLWDIQSGKEIKTLTGHTALVNSLCFSPDGKQILSGSFNKIIKLWDVETGKEIKNIPIRSNRFSSVVFSSDGSKIVFGAFREIIIIDTASGQEIASFCGYATPAISVCYSSDGSRFVSGYDNGTISLFDALNGQQVWSIAAHKDWVRSVCFSPDGKQVLTGSQDNTIKLWDAATGREIKTFLGHTGWVMSAVFSPDGKQILSGAGHGDKTIKLWDIESGRLLKTFSGHEINVLSVCFSPDGKRILSGSGDTTIKLWDVDSGKVIKNFTGHSMLVYSVKFSSDGKQIVSCSGDKTIKIWDAESGKEIRTLTGHTNFVTSSVFSPDSKYIVSASLDNTIRLWDARTGREIKQFTDHTNILWTVSFNHDGKRILSGSHDGTTRIWDIASGKEIASFISLSGNNMQLVSATRGISFDVEEVVSSIDNEWVVITPDGYYAASPQGDRYLNVRIENTVTGIDSFRSVFYNPDVVRARLTGEKDPASKAKVTIQQAARFIPPEVSLQTQTRSVNSPNANISVNIADKNLPVQSIIVMINGRRLGSDELKLITGARGLQANRASLSVTGKQKNLNLTMPVTLSPGSNRIEVVAFNGYSENRRFVDIHWNAPANERPALPNLWILAIGVNKYDNAGEGLGNMRNLNYCVADARGVINSLKLQEGKRYAKVNSLLIADDAEIKPTADNIRKNLAFLDGAQPQDVVLLFLAGHGISSREGEFYFLPSDAKVSMDKKVDQKFAISGDEIVSVLDAPGNRLVLIDACQAGGVDNNRMIRKLMDTNAFVFASSRGNEFSYELPELGHGVFTYSVIDALKGARRARAAKNISVISMSGFVSLDVPERTNRRQHPSAYSLGFYDFPVAVAE